MPTFQILCLANSYKCQGRCIAGLRQDGLGWIRPVSTHLHGTLFAEEYQLPHQQEPRLFDILEIDFIKPLPELHQPENWLISNKPWRLVTSCQYSSLSEKQRLTSFLEHLATPKSYIFNSFEDKISYNHILKNPLKSSLVIVKPENLSFKISTNDKRKIKASFDLKGSHYHLAVTDPIFLKKILYFSDGDYPVEELSLPNFNSEHIFLTISLGEPYHEYCYKLVAGVISIW
ncbi:MAG: hypothetical protein EA365_05100 [Gloeocapsa sp. DLM2.Bin57]|nr:MAG: hypothetical protein EA365_05100 [Gloeocapsa sp. DLM2.Bin57]